MPPLKGEDIRCVFFGVCTVSPFVLYDLSLSTWVATCAAKIASGGLNLCGTAGASLCDAGALALLSPAGGAAGDHLSSRHCALDSADDPVELGVARLSDKPI